MAIHWTAEERAAMAAADAEIEAMPVSSEEVAESNRMDLIHQPYHRLHEYFPRNGINEPGTKRRKRAA